MVHYDFVMSASSQPIFPRRLRAAREMRGLSQAELAERTRLQQAAVSHYEGGTRRPSLRNLRRLSEGLEVTIDYLVGRSNTPEPRPSSDDPIFRDFERLSFADRELARDLVAQLARRANARKAGSG
jgi:transcriptional regulator with XRE-family HTH domain